MSAFWLRCAAGALPRDTFEMRMLRETTQVSELPIALAKAPVISAVTQLWRQSSSSSVPRLIWVPRGFEQDHLGVELSDVETADLEAHRAIPEITLDLMMSGHEPLRCAVALNNEAGQEFDQSCPSPKHSTALGPVRWQ